MSRTDNTRPHDVQAADTTEDWYRTFTNVPRLVAKYTRDGRVYWELVIITTQSTSLFHFGGQAQAKSNDKRHRKPQHRRNRARQRYSLMEVKQRSRVGYLGDLDDVEFDEHRQEFRKEPNLGKPVQGGVSNELTRKWHHRNDPIMTEISH